MKVEVNVEGKIPQLEACYTVKAVLEDPEEIAKFAEFLRPIMLMISEELIKTASGQSEK